MMFAHLNGASKEDMVLKQTCFYSRFYGRSSQTWKYFNKPWKF